MTYREVAKAAWIWLLDVLQAPTRRRRRARTLRRIRELADAVERQKRGSQDGA